MMYRETLCGIELRPSPGNATEVGGYNTCGIAKGQYIDDIRIQYSWSQGDDAGERGATDVTTHGGVECRELLLGGLFLPAGDRGFF